MLLSSLLIALSFPPCLSPLSQEAAKDSEKKVERVALERGKSRPPLVMEWTLASEDPKTPTLVLLHAARSSKGEYRPMVPRLKALGYNCLAVDLVCGGASRDLKNATARAARDAGANPNYLDAIPDILDALNWAREKYAKGQVFLWGSSFSSGLALHVAGENPALVDGVLAFSPGEYFTAVGKGASWVQECAKKVTCPVFVTSAKNEEEDWRAIFEALGSADKTHFLPQGPGTHGSKALWEESEGNAEYWTAVEAFLKRVAPAAPAK
jgi:pimeloyl-ACP methyl ester carboxylesterase